MTLPTCYTPCLVSLSDKSVDDRFYKERLPNLLLKRYLLYRYYVRTEVAHAAAHIQNAFCCFGSCYFDNLAAKVVRREELPHLEFFLGLRIVVIISEIGLFEAVQTSEAGIAVEDRFPGYFPFILVNGFQDSLVVIFPLFLGDRLILDLITHMSMVCE